MHQDKAHGNQQLATFAVGIFLGPNWEGQTNTIWLSAAAYDLTAWGRTEHCEAR